MGRSNRLEHPTDAIIAANEISDIDEQALVYAILSRLKEGYTRENLAIHCFCIASTGQHGAVMQQLASLLPDWWINEAYDLARNVTNPRVRTYALGCLIGRLPNSDRMAALEDAVEAARSGLDDVWRIRHLVELAYQVSAPGRNSLFQEALGVLDNIDDISERLEWLEEIAPRLPEEVDRRLLSSAFERTNEVRRSQVLGFLPAVYPALMRVEGLSSLRMLGKSIRNVASWFE